MSEDKQKEAMNKALFSNLVMMFSSSVMQQLGKLVNPMTNKTEINLEGAQVTIDMISMLKDKAEGNLDKDEEKLISDVLSSLQMNYVEVAKDQKESPSVETAEENNDGKKDEEASDKVVEEKSDVDEKDPKFHKSYDDKDK